MSGAPILILTGGIIGTELAPYPSWATLPIASMVTGLALFTMPASFLMKKIGRRFGFMVGVGIAALASLVAAYAIMIHSFVLFCGAALFIGGNIAFVQQYRFAAAESVESSHTAKAISFVLLGGIAGGYLGPELAKHTRNWLDYGEYTGSFVSLTGLYLFTVFLLFFLHDMQTEESVATGEERTLTTIIKQPLYYTAVLAGVISYGIMSLLMTATPINMHILCGFSLEDTAWVIQSHVIAMYFPSLFTGYLVNRFGLFKVMIAGVAILVVCLGVGLFAAELLHYWLALVLLGVGWNFLFVGGTILLTQTYRSQERFKAQAVNDFTIFGIQAISSLSAGTLIYFGGWELLNYLSMPLLVVMLIVLLTRQRIQNVL